MGQLVTRLTELSERMDTLEDGLHYPVAGSSQELKRFRTGRARAGVEFCAY